MSDKKLIRLEKASAYAARDAAKKELEDYKKEIGYDQKF